jgi:hypothetical protein
MTTLDPTTDRRCPGVPSLARPEHWVRVADFASNAGRPDGLARLCRECAAAYTLARKGKVMVQPEPQVASEPPQIYPTRGVTQTDAGAAERDRLERQLARVGGYGTDAGQQLLRQAARESDEGRRLYQREQKRAQRARAKTEV